MSGFKRATKKAAKLRLALAGPAGSGKTYTALTLAKVLADGGEIAVIDTEHGSASKYADQWGFDVVELDNFSPADYIAAIRAAEQGGYACLIIDSLSHEWNGRGGILQMVDEAGAQSRGGGSFNAWRFVTPKHDELIQSIVSARMHVICTLRAKMEYVQERNERTGKMEPRAVGMKPIQRDEVEYEFDVYGMLDQENRLVIRKSRCPALSGAVIDKPGVDVAAALLDWLAGTPLTPEEREALESNYAELADEAVAFGHPAADKLGTTKPGDLNDDVLRASVEKLAAWVKAQRERAAAASAQG